MYNVALMRNEYRGEVEQELRGENTMAEIRKKASKNEELKTAWLQSVQSLIDLLQ